MFLNNKRGFTLTEMVFAMAIFVTLMIISATAFKTMATQSSQQSKSAETQIGGIVGLDVLRADLEQAGFGLPWSFQFSPTYAEAPDDNSVPAAFWPSGVSPSSFNDATGSAPPRAILSGTTTFLKDSSTNIGSSYLVIKSTIADVNSASKKWTTVSYDQYGVKTTKIWGDPDRDFNSTDRVIVLKNSLTATPATRQLVATSGTNFSGTFASYSASLLMNNHNSGDTYEVYGVNAALDLKRPFNRADYYVMRPATIPRRCAPNTGILYKSIVPHSATPTLSPGMPLLDCVADMQVAYGLDTTNSGTVNLHPPTALAPNIAPLPSASDILSQLKEVRVYILAHEGIKDTQYNYPSSTIDVGESFDGGATIVGRHFNLLSLIGADYKYYRWKVYTIVVRPKNLIQ